MNNDNKSGWSVNGISVTPAVFFLSIPMVAIVESLARKIMYKIVEEIIADGIRIISFLVNKR